MDWNRPWPRPEITAEFLEGDLVLVAEEDGEIIGTAFGRPAHHGRAHLNIACVRTEWRRQGVAKALVAEFAARALSARAQHGPPDGGVSKHVGDEAREAL